MALNIKSCAGSLSLAQNNTTKLKTNSLKKLGYIPASATGRFDPGSHHLHVK